MKPINKDGSGVFKMATEAYHLMGDISRPKKNLCKVYTEDKDNFYGHWIEGLGFIEVRFPKETTSELTEKDKEKLHGKKLAINGNRPHLTLNLRK